MSRTYKDRPYKSRFPTENSDNKYRCVPYIAEGLHWKTKEPYCALRWFSVKRRGVLTKKKKHVDAERHWIHSTPSWWTNMFMNRPQRIASKKWEREIVQYSFWDIAQDNFDPPLIGNKPHVYYW